MIYYTGDIHGQKYEIERFCKRFKPTRDDIIVILGDVAANYSRDERDAELKKALNKLKPTILCIHGNHEIRPWNIPTYKTKIWNGGTVWYEEEYPSVLFARDGEIYDLEGLRHIAIGGAYSVDKFYRIARGYGWWEDEQPSAEIKQYVEQQLKENKIDVILSHRLRLDDYSTASFTSFDKDYFGTLEDIDGLFEAIREDENTVDQFQDILSVYDQYLAGNRKVTHNVAYRDVPFLVPAKVLAVETSVLTDHSWEHVNTWDCIYQMKCDKAESKHIWFSCHGSYTRCIQTRFTNLLYESAAGSYVSHDGWMWGFPHQLEYEPPITESRLYVVEKSFKNKAEAMADRINFIQNPDSQFGNVLDDLFGDG